MADESVLEKPGDHTVEEVVSALDDASPEEVALAQERERQGKARKGILEFGKLPADQEPRYSREEWRARARTQLRVSPHVVAGALWDVGSELLTRDEVQNRIADFLRDPNEGGSE